MGVHGLWKLLEPAGKPIPIESLENKILAVDVSIWLYQLSKGFQTSSGDVVPNAHLVGLFNRICKLLYFRIRPVFVFDGGVPQLKKDIIDARRRQKRKAKDISEDIRQKLVQNLLKQNALSELLIGFEADDFSSSSSATGSSQMKTIGQGPITSQPDDIFALPPLPEKNNTSGSDDEDDEIDSDFVTAKAESMCQFQMGQDLHSVNIETEEFKSLPANVRHDILSEMQATRKQSSWAKIDQMPRESDNFSSFQLDRLLKRRNVQISLDEAAKEMSIPEVSFLEMEKMFKDKGLVLDSVQHQRLASDDVTHFLYVTGKTQDDVRKTQKKSAVSDLKFGDGPCSKSTNNQDEQSSSSKVIENCNNISMMHKAVFMIDSSSSSSLSSSDDELACSNSMIEDSDDDDIMMQAEILQIIKEQTSTADDQPKSKQQCVQNETIGSSVVDDSKVNEIEKSDHSSNVAATCKTEPEVQLNMIFVPFGDKSEIQVDKSMSDTDSDDFIDVSQQTESMDGDAMSMLENYELLSNEDVSRKTSSSREFEVIIQPNNLQLQDDIFSDIFSNITTTCTTNIITNKLVDQNKELIIMEGEDCSTAGQKSKTDDLLHTTCKIADDWMSCEAAGRKQPSDVPSNIEVEKCSAEPSKSSPLIVEVDEVVATPLNFDCMFDDKVTATCSNSPTKTDIAIGGDLAAINEQVLVSSEPLRRLQRTLDKEHQELLEEHGKQERLGLTISQQMILEAQELLRLFGLPYIVAPMEAEAQCAFFDEVGLTDGTITDDSDIWLFGGQKVYKNFFDNRKFVVHFRAIDIESLFKLSREQMVQLAMLVGSDYTIGIQGIGPVTALEILAYFSHSRSTNLSPNDTDDYQLRTVYSVLEDFRKWLRNRAEDDKFITPFSKKLKTVSVSEAFPNMSAINAYLHPTVNDSKETFSWAMPNLKKLRQYAELKFGWKSQKVDGILLPIIRRLEDRNKQTTLEKYFKPTTYVPNELPSVSKRVEKAINQMRNCGDAVKYIEQAKKKQQRRRAPLKSSSDGVSNVAADSCVPSLKPIQSTSALMKDDKPILHAPSLKKVCDIAVKGRSTNIIPQREQDRMNARKRRAEAVRIFSRNSKRGKNRKVHEKAPASGSSPILSESSDSDDNNK